MEKSIRNNFCSLPLFKILFREYIPLCSTSTNKAMKTSQCRLTDAPVLGLVFRMKEQYVSKNSYLPEDWYSYLMSRSPTTGIHNLLPDYNSQIIIKPQKFPSNFNCFLKIKNSFLLNNNHKNNQLRWIYCFRMWICIINVVANVIKRKNLHRCWWPRFGITFPEEINFPQKLFFLLWAKCCQHRNVWKLQFLNVSVVLWGT